MTAARKILLGVAVLTAVGGAVLSWRSARATQDIEAARDADGRELAAARAEAGRIRAEIAEFEKLRARHEAVRQTQSRGATAAAAEALRNRVAAAALPPAAADDPSRQAARLRGFRNRVGLDYFAFHLARGLSEPDTARLEDILAEHEAARLDLAAAARDKGLSSTDTAIKALREQEEVRYQAELTKLLGAEGAKQFQDYQAAAPVRAAVGQLAGTLALTAEPLTPAQTGQLASLFQELNLRERRIDRDLWQQVVERSAAFLTPRQHQEMRAIAAATVEENAFRELEQLIDRSKK